MSDPFIGQIKIFAGNFAPRGFMFCDGQLLQIAQHTALFSIFGTFYGGNGRTTFGLPDLRGRVPLHAGRGPGLSNRTLGESGGTTTHTLSLSQLPSHDHAMSAINGTSTTQAPAGNTSLANLPGGGRGSPGFTPYGASASLTALAGAALTPTGGSQAHDNVQPRLAVNYIVAFDGFFPSRN